MKKKALIATMTALGVAATGWLVWNRRGKTHAEDQVKQSKPSRAAQLMRKAA